MIKGLCTVSTGSVVNILVEGEMPEVGHYYYLESATEGTGAQNRTFHALTMEYWKSGQHSYDVDNYDDFRNQIKRKLGVGFESFIYAEFKRENVGEEFETIKPVIKEVSKKSDIPKIILDDIDMKKMIRGRLKSWTDYSKKQRKETIDNLISEMLQAGINSKKFEEIMKGLEK